MRALPRWRAPLRFVDIGLHAGGPGHTLELPPNLPILNGFQVDHAFPQTVNFIPIDFGDCKLDCMVDAFITGFPRL